jgi:hypothetical protein
MRATTLMQQALGLTPPWTVTRSDFDAKVHRLDVQIDFTQVAASPVQAVRPPTARPTTPRKKPGAISTSSSTRPI